MNRLFDGLSRASTQQSPLDTAPPGMLSADMGRPEPADTAECMSNVKPDGNALRGAAGPKKVLEIEKAPSLTVQSSPSSRLVAWTNPNSLGAEKFRALAVRLGNMRAQHKLSSLQVTSSVINEGKTLVAANLAVTFAKHTRCKTLLIEGDLHRPTLASLFGLKKLKGIGDWWSRQDQDISHFVVRFNGAPLWFLPAGRPCDRPSEILHSTRLEEAFTQLAGRFDWIIVDSTPMLPVIDANLWSRLVDGTLLVVREGIAPLKALKNGLQSLDHPKLIGVVINEASEFDQIDYDGQYYGGGINGDQGSQKLS